LNSATCTWDADAGETKLATCADEFYKNDTACTACTNDKCKVCTSATACTECLESDTENQERWREGADCGDCDNV